MECICNFIWEKYGRAQNEDALVFKQVTKEGQEYLLAVMCDGIGGLPEGENASSFVADSMGTEMLRLLETKRTINIKRWRNTFLRKIYQCHKQLLAYGKEKEIRLGTTLSMLFLCDGKGYILHVGDSAVFIGKNRLKRRTSVHRTKKGALKQALGAGQNLMVEWKRIAIRKGTVILVGSDGFYQRIEEKLTDKDVIKELRKKSMSETELGNWLRSKVNIVKQMGERDNASAVCMVFQ